MPTMVLTVNTVSETTEAADVLPEGKHYAELPPAPWQKNSFPNSV